MHADLRRLAAGPPLPPRILEIADPFLLLRVHRARPPQRLLRIASRRRPDQHGQRLGEPRLLVPGPFAAASGAADPIRRQGRTARRYGLQLSEALAHRRRGHPRGRQHRRHAPPAQRPRLRGGPPPPGSLIQRPFRRVVLVPNPLHHDRVWHTSYHGTRSPNTFACSRGTPKTPGRGVFRGTAARRPGLSGGRGRPPAR